MLKNAFFSKSHQRLDTNHPTEEQRSGEITDKTPPSLTAVLQPTLFYETNPQNQSPPEDPRFN